uniref:Uncharacterized protein n=1 Tax=Rhizophora mucronata TaxID=61149 RepID=A0A2P2QU62_RHIMU
MCKRSILDNLHNLNSANQIQISANIITNCEIQSPVRQ